MRSTPPSRRGCSGPPPLAAWTGAETVCACQGLVEVEGCRWTWRGEKGRAAGPVRGRLAPFQQAHKHSHCEARTRHARTHACAHAHVHARKHARTQSDARTLARGTHAHARPPARPPALTHARSRTHSRTHRRTLARAISRPARIRAKTRAEKSQGRSAIAREHVIARARALDRVQMRSQMADANSQTHARARFRGPTHASRHTSHPYELPLTVDRRGRRRYAQTSAPALSPLTP